MNNVEIFLKGCQLEAYRHREWILALFMVTSLPTTVDEKHYKGRIYNANGLISFLRRDFIEGIEDDEMEAILFNGKPIKADGRKEPVLYCNETITVTNQDVPTVEAGKKIETTPGIVFINWYCFIYALGNKIPFVNENNLSVGKIAQSLASRVRDDMPEEKRDPAFIYVTEFKKMLNAMASLTGFTVVNSPSATEYTVSAAPGIDKLKKELLDKYKDKLDDPTVVAKIEKELVQYDKDYINKDPNKGFYIKGKSFDINRKKLHIMQGVQKRMDPDKPNVLVTTSLYEQTKPEDIPALIDGLRDGSYNRGAATALGGEEVKFIYRIYSAAEIIKEDCGTKMGLRRVIHEAYNPKSYIGTYIIENGKNVLLTEENYKNYIGKEVIMRSPGYCLAAQGGVGYCSICYGNKMRGFEQSLASYGAKVGSVMNGRFMKAMHGTANKAVRIRLSEAIS